MPRCRACGKVIYCINATNLFEQPDKILLHQIEALTGLFLLDQTEFPTHICGPCEVGLREAIAFREQTIRTQMWLLNSDTVTDALQKIDFEEAEKQYVKEIDEQDELSNSSYEEMAGSGHTEDVHDSTFLELDEVIEELTVEDLSAESTQNIENVMSTSEQNSYINDKLERKKLASNVNETTEKSTSKTAISISFENIAKKTRKIVWKGMPRDEMLVLKRERRRRDCICEQCGKHFSCPSNFKFHLLTHTGVKNFTCKQCPLKFYSTNLLKRHEMSHLSEKPFPCRKCDRSYTSKGARRYHERIGHTNQKPFKCTICVKAFPSNGGLRNHLRTHSNVRNYHCKVCDMSFKKRTHLTTHIRSKGHLQNVKVSGVLNIVDVDIEK